MGQSCDYEADVMIDDEVIFLVKTKTVLHNNVIYRF